MSMIDINAIQELLPHRYPFLLVDRVTEVEAGKFIRGYKNITVNEEFFNGHFPGHPILPGVIMLEALAQIGGILGFLTIDKRATDGALYYFAGANKVRFTRPVVPGDRLDMEVTLMAYRRNIAKFDCHASVDGEEACVAEILCAEGSA